LRKPDERLPAELAALADAARSELAEFLRSSRRPHVSPGEVEEELAHSLLLKDALSAVPRQ
jgi:hypothetical protein